MSAGPLLYLSRAAVGDLLPALPEQLDLVEETYEAVAAGDVELPPKPGIHPRRDAFVHAMPAYLRGLDVAALKWVAGYPGNPGLGLPYISGLVVLNDAATGLPTAILDAAEITAARTAAATGVCIRRWAPLGWRRAAIVGCGEQGRYHARVLAALEPDVTIRAFDLDPGRIASLPGRVEPAADALAAVREADVVVTAAPIVEKPDPPLGPEALGKRWLLAPIDFDAVVRREAIEAADRFLVDDVEQFEYYRSQGHFRDWPEPHGSVGEAFGRGEIGERVACVNLGIGALDAAFAARVVTAARERGAGIELQR